jgi:hypothetical protein
MWATPFLFSSLALGLSSSRVRRLVQAFSFPVSDMEYTWREEARFAAPQTCTNVSSLGSCLCFMCLWAQCRSPVKAVEKALGRSTSRMDSQNTCSDDSKFLSSTRPFSSRHCLPVISTSSSSHYTLTSRWPYAKSKACISESSLPFAASSPGCRRSSHFFADCQNENECARNNIKGSLHTQTRACRFSPFQEVKIQEMVLAFNPFRASRLLIVSPRQIRSLLVISPDP